jgi:hypothetical protein
MRMGAAAEAEIMAVINLSPNKMMQKDMLPSAACLFLFKITIRTESLQMNIELDWVYWRL